MTQMAEPAQLLYLEPDDEITSVIRRLRDADPGRVVLVASGRTKATTSALALRLLAGVAAEEAREIALVADATGRALAAEAGIPAFASVAEASAEGAAPVDVPATPRAPIRVVRGEPVIQPPADVLSAPSEPPRTIGPTDETQAVPLPPPISAPAPGARPKPRRAYAPRPDAPFVRRLPRVLVGVLIGLVLLAAAALAAVAPAATIVIEPATFALEPVSYTLTLSPSGTDQGQLTADAQGTATGTFSDPTPASGTVTFYNYSYVTVEIPQDTVVSVDGEVLFATTERVVAPRADTVGLGIQPGQVNVGVVAQEPGPGGNVAAEAINRVENQTVDDYLRSPFGFTGRRVSNGDPTTGGDLNEQPQVTQDDVNAAVAQIQSDLTHQLQEQLTEDPSRVYGPADAGDPVIDVPGDLVGRTGEEAFTLSGTVEYTRDYVQRTAVEQAAVERLLGDGTVAGEGVQVLPGTADVTIGEVTRASDQLSVRVMVSAQATPTIDVDAVRNRVAGMTGLEAADMLGELGSVTVKLWPDWVDRVPQLTWRIDVRVEGSDAPSAEASP